MLQSLAYFAIGSDRLEDWAAYATNLLGLHLAERTSSLLRLRMDTHRQRLLVDTALPPGARILGWDVADSAALDAYAAHLSRHGLPVTAGTSAEADARRVAGLVWFADPVGNRWEIVFGAESDPTPFIPGRNISGFRTGPLGMGHVVLTVAHLAPMQKLVTEILGFRLSDYTNRPFRAAFFHLNPRHHSLALVETGQAGMHHLMLELLSLDDVGQGYDLAQQEADRVAVTLGRHSNDYITSFYSRSPSDFMVEYGWGGRDIEPAGWQAEEYRDGPSLWGHDRNWLSPPARAEATSLRLGAAAKGIRQPVQVLAGNYRKLAGACPWWDAATSDEQGL